MSYKSNRPIAAYTMAEFESLTSGTANFKRGRDKKKRKSRAGLYAGLGAGALALGGAARYGGAAIKTALAQRQLYDGASAMNKSKNKLDDWKNMKMDVNTGRNAMSGGAKGQVDRDVQGVKALRDKVKNYDYKSAAGKLGNVAKLRGQQALGLATSAPGIGVLGAAALAGGGYGIYKSMKKGKKK